VKTSQYCFVENESLAVLIKKMERTNKNEEIMTTESEKIKKNHGELTYYSLV
jgi:hypothetical protein